MFVLCLTPYNNVEHCERPKTHANRRHSTSTKTRKNFQKIKKYSANVSLRQMLNATLPPNLTGRVLYVSAGVPQTTSQTLISFDRNFSGRFISSVIVCCHTKLHMNLFVNLSMTSFVSTYHCDKVIDFVHKNCVIVFVI